jgi:hypothetical protein
MPSMHRPLLSSVSAALATSAAALVFAACSANRNHDERQLEAERQGQSGQPPCYTCETETIPPPLPADLCALATEGLEFMQPAIWDFDGGVARYMYSYQDETSRYIEPTGWEPNAIGGSSPCDPPENSFAFNWRGGPFLNWGGGIGIGIFQRLSQCANNSGSIATCMVPADGVSSACETGFDPNLCPKLSQEFPQFAFDLTGWEGISFWARMGLDSQPGFRINIGDKHTDDDLSFLASQERNAAFAAEAGVPPVKKYCERVRECGCRNGRSCNIFPSSLVNARGQYGNDRYYCWDPATDEIPILKVNRSDVSAMGVTQSSAEQYDDCGPQVCDDIYPAFQAPDDDFNGKPCTLYSRDSEGGDGRASIVPTEQIDDSAYCFDPAVDPPPAEGEQTCGDHWMAPVRLSNEWQFFTVPFTELRQQGFAQESPGLDLTTVSLVRITWDRGWINFWIDDVRFYRRVRR